MCFIAEIVNKAETVHKNPRLTDVIVATTYEMKMYNNVKQDKNWSNYLQIQIWNNLQHFLPSGELFTD